VSSDAQISPTSGVGPDSDSDDAAMVLTALAELEVDATKAVEAAGTVEALREAEAVMTGKRSPLAGLQRRLGGLSPDERREVGQVVNAVRSRLTEAVAGRRADLEASARTVRLTADRLDLTEAAGLADAAALSQGAGWSIPWRGHLNLVTQTRDQLEDTFVALGFAVAEGPEAETDWYNFEALNMPPAHPARGMWDTLYLKLGAPETVLLRTHTSPVQVRLMESQSPPIYAVMPGRCYRRDTPDARHLPVFHQIEGLVVDRGITFGDMAGTIEAFTTAFFGPDIHSRLRPSYFPFTEPSAEFEVTCPICAGAGCRTCSQSGWIELGGCGMVDPAVFAAVGVDPEEFSGFAFGFGIDRLAQVKAGLSDMRTLLDNDLRFLSQF
jgi:phenylalanyl-tRNA synthetase alpha chain